MGILSWFGKKTKSEDSPSSSSELEFMETIPSPLAGGESVDDMVLVATKEDEWIASGTSAPIPSKSNNSMSIKKIAPPKKKPASEKVDHGEVNDWDFVYGLLKKADSEQKMSAGFMGKKDDKNTVFVSWVEQSKNGGPKVKNDFFYLKNKKSSRAGMVELINKILKAGGENIDGNRIAIMSIIELES